MQPSSGVSMSDVNPFEAPDRQGAGLNAEGGPASLTDRFAAYILDSLFVGLLTCGAVGVAATLVAIAQAQSDPSLAESMVMIQLGWMVLSTAFLMIVGIGFELSPWRGTPGKRLLGLEVRSSDGSPASIGDVVTRNLARGLLVNSNGFCTLVFGLSVFLGDGRGLWNMAGRTTVMALPHRRVIGSSALVIVGAFGFACMVAVGVIVALTTLGAQLESNFNEVSAAEEALPG